MRVGRICSQAIEGDKVKTKHSILDILSKLMVKVIELIFVVLILVYLLSCVLYMNKNTGFTVILISIILFLIYIISFHFIHNIKINGDNKIQITIFILSILVYSIWNVFSKTTQVSDYAILFDAAKTFLKGDFSSLSFDKQNYFYYYNFQVGFVLYLATIMKIIGTSVIGIKIVEIIVLAFSNVMVYKIAKKLYSNRVAIITSSLYASLIFNVYGSSVINNQHTSTLFILFSIYFYIKDDNVFSKVISAIFIAISIILRSSSIIFVVAFVCFEIYKLFVDRFIEWRKTAVTILALVLTVVCSLKTYDYVLKKTNIVPVSAISLNAKYFKFIIGTQNNWSIVYGPEMNANIYDDLKYYNFNYDRYNNDCKKYLLDIFSDNNKLNSTVYFIAYKMCHFMGGIDNQIEFATDNSRISQTIIDKISYFGYAQYSLLIFCLCVLLFLSFKIKYYCDKSHRISVLFKIIFIGFFLVHIVLEAQTRYRYDQYLMLCFILTPYIDSLNSMIEKSIITKKAGNYE